MLAYLSSRCHCLSGKQNLTSKPDNNKTEEYIYYMHTNRISRLNKASFCH
jgi:hypothetical protein